MFGGRGTITGQPFQTLVLSVATALALVLALTRADADDSKPAFPGSPPTQTPPSTGSAAPRWAVAYGREFWRPLPAKQSSVESGLNVNEAVERVSHAFISNPTEGVGQVRARDYTATMAGGELRFEPRHAAPDAVLGFPTAEFQSGTPTQTGPASLSFRTVSIRRGERTFFQSGSGIEPSFSLGNTTQTLLSPELGVVEHCQAVAAGIEVAWILSQPLPGTGDLEIETALGGLHHSSSSGQGFHFSDAAGKARVKVGQVRAVDAKGASWDIPTTLAHGTMRALVSKEVLAHAAYPLAIDPWITPETLLDTPVFGSRLPRDQSNPSVASNGRDYFVAWLDTRQSSGDIFGTRVSADGVVLDPLGIVIAHTGNNAVRPPAVASNGSDFIVIWVEQYLTSQPYLLRSAKVAPDGALVKVAGGTLVSGTASLAGAPALAFNGRQFLAAWTDARIDGFWGDIFAARLDRDGAPLDPQGFPVCTTSGGESWPAVASNGHDFYVAWQDSRAMQYRIYGTVVSQEGKVLTPNGDALGGSSPNSMPAVASNGDGFMAAWVSAGVQARRISATGEFAEANPIILGNTANSQAKIALTTLGANYYLVWAGNGIRGAKVLPDGTVPEPNGSVLSGTSTPASQPAVASKGGQLLVSWTEGSQSGTLDVRGARVVENGVPLDPTLLNVAGIFNTEISPAAAFNGTEYLVVWEDNRNADGTAQDIYGARLDRNGVPLDEKAIAISVAPYLQTLPRVASNGKDFFVVWEDRRVEGSRPDLGSEIYGTMVTAAGIVRDPAGLPVCSSPKAQTAPSIASDGTNYFVAWQDSRNNTPTSFTSQVYGTRVSGDGKVLDPDGIVIDGTENYSLSPVVAGNPGAFLVAWNEFCASVLPDGRVGPVRAFGKLRDQGSYPVVAGNGREFLILWQDGASKIQARRVSVSGDPLGDPFPVSPASPAARRFASPSITGWEGGYFVGWTTDAAAAEGLWISGAELMGPPLALPGFQTACSNGHHEVLVIRQASPPYVGRLSKQLIRLLDPIILNDDRATLSWSVEPTKAYQAQYRSEFDASAWINLGSPIVSTNRAIVTDTSASQQRQRFYRLVPAP